LNAFSSNDFGLLTEVLEFRQAFSDSNVGGGRMQFTKFIIPALVLLVSCGETSFNSAGKTARKAVNKEDRVSKKKDPLGPVQDQPVPAVACKDPAKTTKITHRIDFGAQFPSQGRPACQWNSNGNVGYLPGHVSARTENRRSIELGKSQVVCEMTLRSESPSVVVDDAMFLTLNDVELVSTWAGLSAYFPIVDGFRMYSWNHIVGKPYSAFGNTVACVSRTSTCIAPTQEKVGPLALSLSPEDSLRMYEKFKDRPVWDLTLVVTGDDDPGLDCKHSQLAFVLEMTVLK
jgi:hypothetical protein